MTDERKDALAKQTVVEAPEKEALATPPPEASDKPQEPDTLSRRELIGTLPKVALGSWLAMEGDQGLAFGNMMLFKKKKQTQPSSEVYGLWAFGGNYDGRLGLGDVTDRSSPVQVGTLSNWSQLWGGSFHTMARRTDGTLWAFGDNAKGQLGLGSTTNRSSPDQVGSLSSWTEVTGGYSFTMARRTDGTLWAFGYNANGQLGIGIGTDHSSPVQVGSLSSWTELAVGARHTVARRTDGTLWAFGGNSYGQLGLGNVIPRSSNHDKMSPKYMKLAYAA